MIVAVQGKGDEMRVLGVAFGGEDAFLVVVEKNKDQGIDLVIREPKKLGIKNAQDTEALCSFSRKISALIKENKIDVVSIKACTEKGKFKSGAAAFKMEAVFQLLLDVRVVLQSPQTVTAASKSYSKLVTPDLMKYQHPAFFSALIVLHED